MTTSTSEAPQDGKWLQLHPSELVKLAAQEASPVRRRSWTGWTVVRVVGLEGVELVFGKMYGSRLI